MPSTRDQADQDAMRFVAALGAAMASSNYPVTMIRTVMEGTSRAYGLDSQFLALPNYVRVGSPTGEGVSMMSIALGVQTGILLWRRAIQLTGTPQRRAIHD